MNKDQIKALVLQAGGPRYVAGRIGMSRQAVAKWERVPAEHVRLLEALTGVAAEKIRPDVFGSPLVRRTRQADRAAA